jgi:hypothetical protein
MAGLLKEAEIREHIQNTPLFPFHQHWLLSVIPHLRTGTSFNPSAVLPFEYSVPELMIRQVFGGSIFEPVSQTNCFHSQGGWGMLMRLVVGPRECLISRN